MLILSRRKMEGIVIGTGSQAVTVTVLSCRDGVARLGISGPREIQVDRLELREQKEKAMVQYDLGGEG